MQETRKSARRHSTSSVRQFPCFRLLPGGPIRPHEPRRRLRRERTAAGRPCTEVGEHIATTTRRARHDAPHSARYPRNRQAVSGVEVLGVSPTDRRHRLPKGVATKSRGSRPMVWRRSTPSRSLTLAHRPLLLCAGLESLVRCQSYSWMTVPSRCAQLPNSPWPAPIRARNPRPSSPQCVQHPALTTARRWPTVCRTSFMTVRPASVSGSPACVLTCRA